MKKLMSVLMAAVLFASVFTCIGVSCAESSDTDGSPDKSSVTVNTCDDGRARPSLCGRL